MPKPHLEGGASTTTEHLPVRVLRVGANLIRRSRTEGPQPLTNITGRTVGLLLPPYDTPQDPEAVPPRPGSVPPAGTASDAATAWRAVTPFIAGAPHVRVSRDGGRTYPARHARSLPLDAPGQPCTVPVFDPGSGTGRMLALDLDPGRAGRDVHDGAVLWVPRLGGRAPLGAELGQVARVGRWDRSRYAGRSEVRMAVLTASAARGWPTCSRRSPPAFGRASRACITARLSPAGWTGSSRWSGEKRSPSWRDQEICVAGSLATLTHAPPQLPAALMSSG